LEEWSSSIVSQSIVSTVGTVDSWSIWHHSSEWAHQKACLDQAARSDHGVYTRKVENKQK
jgi:hypothetical protein